MLLVITVEDPLQGFTAELRFEKSPVRIGRGADNEVVLKHSLVSESHAEIQFDETSTSIVDLGSRNGTLLQGQRLPRQRPTPLDVSSTVEIGPFRVAVSSGADAAVGDGATFLPGEPEPRWDEAYPAFEPAQTPFEAPFAPPEPPQAPFASRPASPWPPATIVPPPTAVVRELPRSLDELEYLWRTWEDGLVSPVLDLAGLSYSIEERLQRAFQDVGAGGEALVESLLAPALASEQGWRLTVAAHLAMRGAGRESLLSVIGEAVGARLTALRRGVELASSEVDVALVEWKLAQGGPEQKAALLALQAFRRRPPGPELEEVLNEESGLRALALRAARLVPNGGALSLVEAALGDPDAKVRQAAVESGLVLGSPAAWNRCRELARSPSAAAAVPLLLVAALGTERDHELVFAALRSTGTRRAAIKALASVGTLQAAEACLEAMSVEHDARLAAEAFCGISGLDLRAENLVATDAPAPEEAAPLELGASLTVGPDDRLPPPDVAGVRRWWGQARKRFVSGARYVSGKPVSLAALGEVLERGPMRRRPLIALELAIRTGGRHDVETRAFTTDQRRQLRSFEPLEETRAQPSSLTGLISRI